MSYHDQTSHAPIISDAERNELELLIFDLISYKHSIQKTIEQLDYSRAQLNEWLKRCGSSLTVAEIMNALDAGLDDNFGPVIATLERAAWKYDDGK